ncbi:SAM-dependent DNA methyltransferase (plasmid) [Sphingobium fuliginis]|uniref:SAM-dependent DNA methyltransferase n=2 Tax=Sphingobium fuliginis (strain ATCC 27551) TaxID=336203 RepID=A0A7M2GQV3_SPHSA|nr:MULTISPECIES: N-6 DNA methylase [Sphingobium]QOT74537.1 SAM-dependent DNA methyltransferase [Sphingobium fuliginis]
MSATDRHIKTIQKLFNDHRQHHDIHSLFSDCMEMAALSIANAVDLRSYDDREARYLDIAGRYDRRTIEMFPKVLAEVTLALEAEPCDILGEVFSGLEIHNKYRGQFFTPYPVCQLMAQVTGGDRASLEPLIAKKGFVTAVEPACGAGAMIIALSQAMREAGINYQQHLHVTAIDIDPRAVHMAFIQFSLLHIPACVVLGDSLAGTTRDRWFTPAHILGGWSRKLARRRESEPAAHFPVQSIPAESQPTCQGPPPALPPRRGEQLSLF